MTIPDFQTLMLPLLKLAADGEEHAVADARKPLAQHFGLTEAEQSEMLPSGQQSRFGNRVAWAKVYLERGGLLSKPRRAYFRITDRGRDVLKSPPAKIDIAFLNQFPGFKEFRKGSGSTPVAPAKTADEQTPEEAIESAYQKIREDLATELLEQVKSAPAQFFEKLVLQLLLKMGYGGFREEAGAVTPPGADAGIDGIIKEDRLGLDSIYLQAKRWANTVGRPEVQKFVGALQGKRLRKGVFITTSSFTADAVDYAAGVESKIVLIDGDELAQFMIDFDIGVSRAESYEIKRLDSDYFAES